MDRDKRWERVKLAYDALVNGIGQKTTDWKSSVATAYAEGITDEFLKPIIITDEKGEACGNIKEDDVVICFNFRTDRCREITEIIYPAGSAGCRNEKA